MMHQTINVRVVDEELWRKFEPTAEMILTKPGRRLFPMLEYKINGLNPKDFYAFELRMERCDNIKYKFDKGEWSEASKGEPRIINNSIRHSDGFRSGDDWMNTTVSFSKCKITNNPAETRPTHLVLQSMHKYIPVLSICRMASNPCEPENVGNYRFDFTSFYAVTAYQNHEITCLKKENNKYASGFRSKENRKRARSDSPDGGQDENKPLAKMPWMENGFGHYYPQMMPSPFVPQEESMVAMGMMGMGTEKSEMKPFPLQQLQNNQFTSQTESYVLQQQRQQNYSFNNYYDTKNFENFNSAYAFNSQYPQYPGQPINFPTYPYAHPQYYNNFMQMGMPIPMQPVPNQSLNQSQINNSSSVDTSPNSSYHSS